MKIGLIILLLCGVAFGVGTLMFSPKKCTSCGALEFKSMVESGEYKIIDIRTEEEYASGHLVNSTQIDYYQTEEFNNYLDSLDKNGKYLIYCRTGNRSGKALELMKSKGFENVADLSGGITAWTAAGMAVIKN